MAKKATLLHVASLVYGVPLAATRERLDDIADVLDRRAAEGHLEIDAASMRGEAPDESSDREPTITAEGIGVLPVMGTFVKRAGMMDALSGLTSYATLGRQFDALHDNPAVRAILLRGETPGGQVSGMFELAAKIRQATKPVWAVADDHAFSAGYLLLSAADRVFLPEDGWLGSIGIRAMRRDDSAANAKEGRRRIVITSGEEKADGDPDVPVTDKELARLQAKVDQVAALFFAAVAKHRGLSVEAVAALKGGTLMGQAAVDAGLADGLKTYDQALAALTAYVTKPQGLAATAAPVRRRAMDEGQEGKVTPIATHPGYEAEAARIRQEAEAAQAAYADEVATLCVLAGAPEKLAEFIAAKTPLAEVRAWARREKAARDAGPTPSGVHPPETARTARKLSLTSAELFAKRAQELEADRAKNPIIQRIHATA